MKFTPRAFTLVPVIGLAALAFATPTPTVNTTESHTVLASDEEILLNNKIEAINRLMFNTSLQDFLQIREAQDPPYVDWFSNGCNQSPDHPLNMNFVQGCYRHDFGYQNFRAINQWNKDIRKQVDKNFRKDLFGICKAQVLPLGRPLCYTIAEIYYLAVRAFGGDANSRSAKVAIVENDGAIILEVGGVEKYRVDRNTTFSDTELWDLDALDALEQDEMLVLP